MDSYRRRQIEQEERIRHEARERLLRNQENSEFKYQRKMSERQKYVETYGKQGAFTRTIIKWTIGGLILMILSAIGGCQKGEAAGDIVSNFFVGWGFCIGVGFWRATSMIKSV